MTYKLQREKASMCTVLHRVPSRRGMLVNADQTVLEGNVLAAYCQLEFHLQLAALLRPLITQVVATSKVCYCWGFILQRSRFAEI